MPSRHSWASNGLLLFALRLTPLKPVTLSARTSVSPSAAAAATASSVVIAGSGSAAAAFEPSVPSSRATASAASSAVAKQPRLFSFQRRLSRAWNGLLL